MRSWELSDPWWLLLLLLLPLLVIWRFGFRAAQEETVKAPSIEPFGHSENWLGYIKPFFFSLRLIALGLMIIALARPRTVSVSTKVKSDEGIDIMMVVDVSLSMLARDLKPTRLSALQEVAEKFVTQRLTDRIGMVVYSGEAITKVPLTTDRSILANKIRNLKTNELESGTAIGIGLATAINNLKNSKAESKVVLLITDGGESDFNYSQDHVYIRPEDAAQIAAEKDIKVYTIGIGTLGYVLPPRGYENYPQGMFKLDENLLKFIAKTTNGLYFRATDNKKLSEIYNEIDQMEKSEISEIKYYNYTEYFRTFLIPGLLLLLLEFLLRTTVFKQLR